MDSQGSKRSSDEALVVIEDTEADDVKTAQPKYELLALYGFSANCPNNARLEFNPKARREKGDLVLHLEEGFKVFLSWGSLQEARRRYISAAAQASGSIERSIRSTRARLEGTPETKNLKIQGHEAVYTHARMSAVQGGFGSRRVVQDSHSMHLHCEDSKRYYVVYAFVRPDQSEQLRKVFEPIVSSLNCHLS